jgi:hypothetical protein
VTARTYTVRVPARVTVDADGAVTRVDFDRDELVERIPLITEVTDDSGTRTDPDDATRQADRDAIDAYLAAHVQTIWPAEH